MESVVADRYQECRQRFLAHKQEHVFLFWDELTEIQKSKLLTQLESIDLELMDELAERFILGGDHEDSTNEKLSPPIVIPIARDEKQRTAAATAKEKGEELLRSGKVGIILVAGGQATRLGFNGPKGKFPVTPVAKKSLFQLNAEKILALQEKYGTTLPWYIMTSETNNDESVEYFQQNNFFGLNGDAVYFFKQGMIPSLDENGKLFLQEKGRVFTNPNGHGGTLQALKDGGCLEDMMMRGVEELAYLQVDNVLSKVCDPVYIGYHALGSSDLSCKVVAKKDAYEKVGVVGYIGDRLTVIEYSDLPETQMLARNEDGSLQYSAGNIATHMIKRTFVERLTEGTFKLPFHVAHKKIPHIDQRGETIQSDSPNGFKFETFIFDALQFASNPVVMEVERNIEFSPVKNAEGDASAETARQDLCNLYGDWLEKAGISVPREPETGKVSATLEISPLYALDADEFQMKVSKSLRFQDGLYLNQVSN